MEKILFIDDDPAIRTSFKVALQNICEVIEAATGEEGITLAIKHVPSLILVDIMLPGLSGYDVALKLRQFDHLKDTPIIAISAVGRTELESRARALGFDDYMIKPVDILYFRRLIAGYLSGEIEMQGKDNINKTIREYSIELIDRLQLKIEELKSEKSFTESIIQSLSSGLMILDPKGRILTMNPEGRKIFSVFSENVDGVLLADIIGADKADDMSEMRKNTLYFRNEVELYTKQGGDRIIGFTTAPRVNAAGEMDGIIVSFRDITDIKHIQKEMEKVSRMSTIAEIASAVAHEIRNPLAGIKTMAQSIEENLADADENKEYISRIVKQVDRLNDILKAFFTYARPAKPKIAKISLVNIINEVKPFVENTLREKNILMVENYERGLPDILADPNQIQQVFLNLLLNSIEAIGKKGRIDIIAKSLRPDEREAYSLIFPKLKDKDNYILLKCSDNGCGMSRETAEKIFEPFFTTKTSGSGLGLSIVYRILQENNAAIFVDSVEDAGTTFIIFLETDRKWEKFSS